MTTDWDKVANKWTEVGIIVLITTLAGLFTGLLALILAKFSLEINAWIPIGLFLVLWIGLAYLAISFKKVEAREMGLVLRFGEIKKKTDPGRVWIFYGIDKLIRAPSTQFNLNFEAKEAMSKQGEYPENNGKIYHAIPCTVNTSLYLSLPTNEDKLIKCYKTLGSFDPDAIAKHFDDAIFGAMRVAIGGQTWKESSENREKIVKKVRALLTIKEGDSDATTRESNPFHKAGIKDWYLTITDLKWPDTIENALSQVEESQMKADAAVFDAKANEEQMNSLKTTIQSFVGSGITPETAAKMVFQRHGDLIVADKGKLQKIIIESGGEDSLVSMLAKIIATKDAMSSSSGGNQVKTASENDNTHEGSGNWID